MLFSVDDKHVMKVVREEKQYTTHQILKNLRIKNSLVVV